MTQSIPSGPAPRRPADNPDVAGAAPPLADITAPIVIAGRGGSGTRLFSVVLQQLGVFLGNRLNRSDDSVEWVETIYRLGVHRLATGASAADAVDALRACAAGVLAQAPDEVSLWGWKLPETMLILPDAAQAFAAARFVHVVRHPLDTCLRRTHMTSRIDNPIGEATLRAAYRQLGWERDPAGDPDHIRNAASWAYQLADAQAFFARLPPGRGLTLRYESLCDEPDATAARMAAFVGVAPRPVALRVDDARRRLWSPGDERIDEVWAVCGALAEAHGYTRDGGA